MASATGGREHPPYMDSPELEILQQEIAKLGLKITKKLDHTTLVYMLLHAQSVGIKALTEERDDAKAYIQLMHFMDIFMELQEHPEYIKNKNVYDTLISPASVAKVIKSCETLCKKFLDLGKMIKLIKEIITQKDNENNQRLLSAPVKYPLMGLNQKNPQVLQVSQKQNTHSVQSHNPPSQCGITGYPHQQRKPNIGILCGSSLNAPPGQNQDTQNENSTRADNKQILKSNRMWFEGRRGYQENGQRYVSANRAFLSHSTSQKSKDDPDSSVLSHSFMNYAFIEHETDRQVHVPQTQHPNGAKKEATHLLNIVPGADINNTTPREKVNKIEQPPPQVPNASTKLPKIYNGSYEK